jgi:hypothetical protein
MTAAAAAAVAEATSVNLQENDLRQLYGIAAPPGTDHTTPWPHLRHAPQSHCHLAHVFLHLLLRWHTEVNLHPNPAPNTHMKPQ